MTLNEQLIEAAKKGDIKTFDDLVKQGADVNYKDVHGDSSLLWAAYNGQIEMLDQLTSKTIIANSLRLTYMALPPAFAAHNGQIEMLRTPH